MSIPSFIFHLCFFKYRYAQKIKRGDKPKLASFSLAVTLHYKSEVVTDFGV